LETKALGRVHWRPSLLARSSLSWLLGSRPMSAPQAHPDRELRQARYRPLMNVGTSLEPEYLYNLGTMVPPATINMHQELTKAEWTQLNEAAGAIEQLAAPFHYRLVELNFKQLQNLHQYVSITISLGKEFATANRQKLVESVMGATVNWLTAMRMFLDHEETQLKRKYGESSSEFATFKEATRQAYDGVVGYRFAYEFRNYVQHCGLPLNHLVITAPAVPQTHLKQDTKLLLDRDNLLAEFNNWKRVKTDLQAMDPRFEMLPLLEGAMSGIRAINRACTQIDLDKALASAPVLASALNRLNGLTGEPMLFRYRGTLHSKREVTDDLLKLHDRQVTGLLDRLLRRLFQARGQPWPTQVGECSRCPWVTAGDQSIPPVLAWIWHAARASATAALAKRFAATVKYLQGSHGRSIIAAWWQTL
jgi:hypothetical protein